MKKIPETFNKNGMTHKLLKRKGMIALYESSHEDEVRGYEVHKIRWKKSMKGKIKQRDGTFQEIDVPDREILASNEDFGTYGWSYQHKENAIKKYEELSLEGK